MAIELLVKNILLYASKELQNFRQEVLVLKVHIVLLPTKKKKVLSYKLNWEYSLSLSHTFKNTHTQ